MEKLRLFCKTVYDFIMDIFNGYLLSLICYLNRYCQDFLGGKAVNLRERKYHKDAYKEKEKAEGKCLWASFF